MSTLTVFYDGRKIGCIDRWRQEGRALVLEGNTLGLLDGMVIELIVCDGDPTRLPDNPFKRIGALVEETSNSNVLIQLDDLTTLRTQ